MTELSIHIPRELAITADSIIEEQQIPLIAADRIGRGIIHPDRLPPSIPTLTQVYEAVLQHEGKTDPHPQYATDSEFTSHASDSTIHLPAGGISNSQIAPGAAIDWAKISKSGATAADVGAQASNSRLSEIGSLFAAAPSGASLRKNNDGSALEFAVARSRILHRWSGTEIITGSTSEINFVNGSFTIPGGTLSSSSTLEIYACLSNGASANNKPLRLKVGGVTIFSNNLTTGLGVWLFRQLFLSSLTSQISPSSTLYAPGTSGLAPVSLSLDFSQNQTIQLTGQLVDISENITLRYFEVREAR